MTDRMPPIEYSTYIAAPIAAVYRALTSDWDGWFTADSSIDARPGGSYRFRWDGFGPTNEAFELAGPVLEADGARVFSFDWGSGEGMTTVRFELTRRGEGTVVAVSESGYSWSAQDVAACLNCAAGWGEALTLLKFYLEHGVSYGTVPPP